MNTLNLCQYLEWDSQFFSRNIARVTKTKLAANDMPQILAWCKENKIDCLYFLADSTDSETARLVEDNHFRMVDIRVTFEKQIKPPLPTPEEVPPNSFRQCRLNDIPIITALAGTSYRQSRYYFDTDFPVDLADKMYEVWTEKCCTHPDWTVFVAQLEDKPVGYIACKHVSPTEGKIDLIAVDPSLQKTGTGQKLVKRSLLWFAEQEYTTASVVTQGQNVAAQRLYQRCGFLLRSVELWYHRWFISV